MNDNKNLMDSDNSSDLESLFSIDRYIKVLVEAFPIPLNQTKIADAAGVSRAAVSKIRNDLKLLCDVETLAYDKKYVLKIDNNTASKISIFSLLYKDFSSVKSFFKSNYFNAIVKENKVYDLIGNNLKKYNFSNYFSEDDVFFVLKFIQLKIISYDIKKLGEEKEDVFSYFSLFDSREYKAGSLFTTMYILFKIIFTKDLSFVQLEDFIRLLEIRDKSYFFIQDNIKKHPEVFTDLANWFEVKVENEYKEIMQGISILSKFIVKRMFKSFTDIVFEEAKKQNISIEEDYKTIGYFYQDSE